MPRAEWLLALLLLMATAADAASPRTVLARGAALQESGQVEAAREAFLEGRVEHPASVELIFAYAGAEVALAEAARAAGRHEEALKHHEAARRAFGRCAVEPRLAYAAGCNGAAGLIAMEAVMKSLGDTRERRLEALETAITELAALTNRDDADARADGLLDKARYRRALLLQEADSSPEEQPDESKDDDAPVSEVVQATTQLPNARAVVEEGAMVVLQMEESP